MEAKGFFVRRLFLELTVITAKRTYWNSTLWREVVDSLLGSSQGGFASSLPHGSKSGTLDGWAEGVHVLLSVDALLVVCFFVRMLLLL